MRLESFASLRAKSRTSIAQNMQAFASTAKGLHASAVSLKARDEPRRCAVLGQKASFRATADWTESISFNTSPSRIAGRNEPAAQISAARRQRRRTVSTRCALGDRPLSSWLEFGIFHCQLFLSTHSRWSIVVQAWHCLQLLPTALCWQRSPPARPSAPS